MRCSQAFSTPSPRLLTGIQLLARMNESSCITHLGGLYLTCHLGDKAEVS